MLDSRAIARPPSRIVITGRVPRWLSRRFEAPKVGLSSSIPSATSWFSGRQAPAWTQGAQQVVRRSVHHSPRCQIWPPSPSRATAPRSECTSLSRRPGLAGGQGVFGIAVGYGTRLLADLPDRRPSVLWLRRAGQASRQASAAGHLRVCGRISERLSAGLEPWRRFGLLLAEPIRFMTRRVSPRCSFRRRSLGAR